MRSLLQRLIATSLTAFAFIAQSVHAWDCHFLLTYISLKNIPEVSHEAIIPAEPLSQFLEKERTGLIDVLEKNEEWSQKNIPYYPPLPKNLAFKGTHTEPLQLQFIKAIRISPLLEFPLFVQVPPNIPHITHRRPLKRSDVMLTEVDKAFWVFTPNPPLEEIVPNEKISPLSVITSAVDEPDYGMDIYLWQNNPSWFGKIYQWGKQSFGNETVAFSSQAPFHMGLYFESSLLYAFMPGLKRCFPEYRFHLYLALSQYAFQSGHSYWGYRFLGWALHYAQDLTQPYHAKAAPNVLTFKIMTRGLLNLIGIHSFEQNTIQLITNRHFSSENYTYYLVKDLVEKKDENNYIMQSLQDQKADAQYPNFNSSQCLVKIIAKESNDHADTIDEEIRKSFPKKYVMDPHYIFYTTEKNVDLLSAVKKNNLNMQSFDRHLAVFLRAFGAHTRKIVRYAISNATIQPFQRKN